MTRQIAIDLSNPFATLAADPWVTGLGDPTILSSTIPLALY